MEKELRFCASWLSCAHSYLTCAGKSCAMKHAVWWMAVQSIPACKPYCIIISASYQSARNIACENLVNTGSEERSAHVKVEPRQDHSSITTLISQQYISQQYHHYGCLAPTDGPVQNVPAPGQAKETQTIHANKFCLHRAHLQIKVAPKVGPAVLAAFRTPPQ